MLNEKVHHLESLRESHELRSSQLRDEINLKNIKIEGKPPYLTAPPMAFLHIIQGQDKKIEMYQKQIEENLLERKKI